MTILASQSGVEKLAGTLNLLPSDSGATSRKLTIVGFGLVLYLAPKDHGMAVSLLDSDLVEP